MKIITSYPIISNKKVIANQSSYSGVDSKIDVDYANYCNAEAEYSNVGGGKLKRKTKKSEKTAGKKMINNPQHSAPKGQKIMNAFNKAKESGLVDSLKNLGRGFIDKKMGKGAGTDAPPDGADNTPPSPEEDGKMSKNTKIILGVVGGLVVVGGIILLIRRRRK